VLETKEQRVDRNCQCQRQRLAAATPEHNHSRRHRFANSELTITIDTSIPMMENQLVIVKITEYHSYCPVILCHQIQWENCHVLSNNYMCTKCTHDSVTPNLYSIANNIDPGPIPPELQVRVHYNSN
jgi:hypothetical protein